MRLTTHAHLPNPACFRLQGTTKKKNYQAKQKIIKKKRTKNQANIKNSNHQVSNQTNQHTNLKATPLQTAKQRNKQKNQKK